MFKLELLSTLYTLIEFNQQQNVVFDVKSWYLCPFLLYFKPMFSDPIHVVYEPKPNQTMSTALAQ